MIGLTPTLDALEDLANGITWPEGYLAPNVYRWWEPNMRMPAVWHWLAPSTTTTPDTCTVRDALRLTVSIGVLPGAHTGEDAESLEAYADAYVPALDGIVMARGYPWTNTSRRAGLGPMASEKLGDTTVLALEIPLELVLEHPLTLTPAT